MGSNLACRTLTPRARISSAVNVLALFRGNSFSGIATILLTYATRGAESDVSHVIMACSRCLGTRSR